MNKLPNSGSKRVQEYIAARLSDAKVQLLPESTATSEEAARALGVPVHLIGKSIVFEADNRPVVAILSGVDRVDKKLLALKLRISVVSRPTAVRVKELTGFPIGGVSPFALPKNAIIVMDKGLCDYDLIFVAAGHPRAVVRTTPVESRS